MSTHNICFYGEISKIQLTLHISKSKGLSEILWDICTSTYQIYRPRWLSWMRCPTGDQEVAGSTPAEVGNILFVEIDHEIFSTVILSLPLIQEGQLSVSGERMCTILVNRLED